MSKETRGTAHVFAFIPNQIEAKDGYDPHLIGFPLNILFAGIRKDVKAGQQSLVRVCYWLAPETFREDSQRKEMCYFRKLKNGYFILVIYEKKQADGRRKSSKATNSYAARSVRHLTER